MKDAVVPLLFVVQRNLLNLFSWPACPSLPQPVRQKEVLKQSDGTNSTGKEKPTIIPMYFSLCMEVLSTISSLLLFTAETPAAPAAPVLVLSCTERQLLELTKKRAELEGSRSDVVRATEVLTF